MCCTIEFDTQTVNTIWELGLSFHEGKHSFPNKCKMPVAETSGHLLAKKALQRPNVQIV